VDALKTKTFDGGNPTITLESRQQNGRSQVIVRDNGPGIPKEHLDKIFDPFFTTKEVGKGMGLGLGICYKIVQECGGNISVRTEPGQFCEFTLDFPAEGTGSSK
jgi:signal transduction histidine kinase